MALLKPSEVLASEPGSISPDELVAMVQHYGFEPSYGKSHITFEHREYSPQPAQYWQKRGEAPCEIANFKIPHTYEAGVDSDTMHRAANACLEVKRLNKERRAVEPLDPIPDWIEGAIPEIFPRPLTIENNVLRMMVEPHRPPGGKSIAGRGYSIKCKGNELTVTSLNYPDQHFTIELSAKASEPEQQFTKEFAALEEHVRMHMKSMRKFYNNSIAKLKPFGFEVTSVVGDRNHTSLQHVTHPQYHLDSFIPVCRDGDPIPNYIGNMVGKIERAHDVKFHQQPAILGGLKQRGWHYRQIQLNDDGRCDMPHGLKDRNARGESGRLEFTKDGKTFQISSYGALGMFDMDLLQQRLEEHETPMTRVGSPELQAQAMAPSGMQML